MLVELEQFPKWVLLIRHAQPRSFNTLLSFIIEALRTENPVDSVTSRVLLKEFSSYKASTGDRNFEHFMQVITPTNPWRFDQTEQAKYPCCFSVLSLERLLSSYITLLSMQKNIHVFFFCSQRNHGR